MPRYKIIYDKTHCIGANRCMGIHPKLWGKNHDKKAILNGGSLNPDTGNYELDIDERDLTAYKESALICPAYVIDVMDSSTNKSVLNIKPTKQPEKENVPVL